jgi:hypothetical protein
MQDIQSRFGSESNMHPAFLRWGSKVNPISISVNNVLIDVTENLGTALRYIRAFWGEITLWVNAICIDQDDLEERAGQFQ